MASDTITLALNGEVPLELFAEATSGLSGLVLALSKFIAPATKIVWLVDDLQPGSSTETVRGYCEVPGLVAKVSAAYIEVGRALRDRGVVPFPSLVTKEAQRIPSVLNGKVRSVRFETQDEDVTILSPGATSAEKAEIPPAFSSIEGTVQTLSNRNSLRFTLYDTLHDKAVSCYLRKGQEEKMRSLWGERVLVSGLVTRDPVTWRPVTIRRITDVERAAEAGDYTRARGAVEPAPGQPSAAEAIRRLRDG